MKHYFQIYLLLIKLNYRRSIANRADLFTGLFGSLSWGVFSIVSIYILSARSSSVFGWSRAELFILIGVFNIMVGSTFRMLFSRNFENFSKLMRYGELDGVLLKPLDTQFAVSTQHISLYVIIRAVIACIYTYIVIVQSNAVVSFLSFLSFFILAIIGLILLYACWFLVMTLTVWLPDIYNLDEILYSTDALTRYPPQILNAMKILVFYLFFPFTLVVSTPTKALLHKLSVLDVVILVGFACGLLFISRKFWKFALRYYTSASG